MGHPSAPTDNLTEPNFGCSNVYNFAAMVADPHHLYRGASSIYYLGQRGAADVTAYREDKVKRCRQPERFTTAAEAAGGGGGGRAIVMNPAFLFGVATSQQGGFERNAAHRDTGGDADCRPASDRMRRCRQFAETGSQSRQGQP